MTNAGDLSESAPIRLASDAVMQKAGAENFSVASRLLPRRYRDHLLALYGYARLIDDIGDLAEGDRLAQLDWAEAELDRGLAGNATHPIFVRAARTAVACEISREVLMGLIEANRLDQRKRRYADVAELMHYCSLSANPVGRMVLAIFGESYHLTDSLSDDICTALQIIEHLQDLAEDYQVDRIYLPAEDLAKFGVEEKMFGAPIGADELRRLVAFEVARANELIRNGRPLLRLLHGAARLAVAGFIGGGLAQIDAFAAANFDPLATVVKASKWSMIEHVARCYLGSGRGSGENLQGAA